MVRSICDKVKARFDVRVSEVGGHGTWQSVELGFALVGTDRGFLDSLIEKVIRYIEGVGEGELVADFRDSLYYGDDAEFASMPEGTQ